MDVTAPPFVGSFEDLETFQQEFSNSIIVSFDVENIDHLPGEKSALNKLSELGCAWIDMRTITTKSPVDAAKTIQVRHGIVSKWSCVTARTCLTHRSRSTGWQHTAAPYEGQFAVSQRFLHPQTLVDKAFQQRDFLSRMNRTPEEIATNAERKVIILYWASFLEEKTFIEGGWTKATHGRTNTQYFDFQLWSPIKERWWKQGKSQAPCADAMSSLGVPSLINYHNAGNDAYAEVLGMARFLLMNQTDFEAWTGGAYLEEIDMSWVDPRFLEQNKARELEERPTTQKYFPRR